MPPKRKRDHDNQDEDETNTKRFKADPTELLSFESLNKDSILSIAAQLDIFGAIALLTISKYFAKHLSNQMWCDLALRRLGAISISNNAKKSLDWRRLFASLARSKRPLQHFESLLSHIKSAELSDLQRLQVLSRTIASQQYQQMLIDQAQVVLKTHPRLQPLWDVRMVYVYHEVFAAAEWSDENYKWDVTSTAPVKLVVIGTNGQALVLTSLTSYFASAWAYSLLTYFLPQVVPLEQVFSAQGPRMKGYSSEDDEENEKPDEEENEEPDEEDDDEHEREDRDQNQWFRVTAVSPLLLPFTPQEDDTDEHFIKRLKKKGWQSIDDYAAEEFTKLLKQIGLTDVSGEEFKSLYERATFPNREHTRYYTHLRGYYAPLVPESSRALQLEGVGGLCNWGSTSDMDGNK